MNRSGNDRLTSARASLFCLALSGCAPAVASYCSVQDDVSHGPISTTTLTNLSVKPIVSTLVLIRTKRNDSATSNRLFKVDARIGPGESRVVHGNAVDDFNYDFKDFGDAKTGCELDRTVFADGTTWEAPSPL